MNNIPLYDKIGHSYNQFRQADTRLATKIMQFFPLIAENSAVLEIGCGTGNYTSLFAESGYPIIALDPSSIMLNQCAKHNNIFPLLGTAENLPHDFPHKISAIVSVMSIQHWNNPLEVINSLHKRFPNIPIILFTFDPRLSSPMWLYDYFPDLYQLAHKQFPSLQQWQNFFVNHDTLLLEVIPFLIPDDFSDQFAPTQWKHPDFYLDPSFRRSTSGFFAISEESVKNSVATLEEDLKTGLFNSKYEAMLKQKIYDLGFRVVVIK